MAYEGRRIAGPPSPVVILDDEGNIIVSEDGLKIIDIVHKHVHEGIMFHAEHGAASVANNNSLDLRILTGTKECHISIAYISGGQSSIFLYEGITVTGGGNLLTPFNMNRTKANLAETRMYTGASMTFPSGTALINGRVIPGGTSPTTRIGAEARQGIEWEFKPLTNYGCRITNTSGANVPVWFIAEFYEE